MNDALTNAAASLDKAMTGLSELERLFNEQAKRQAEELRDMIAASGVPVYCSSNLQPYSVSILVGEKLWKLIKVESA